MIYSFTYLTPGTSFKSDSKITITIGEKGIWKIGQ